MSVEDVMKRIDEFHAWESSRLVTSPDILAGETVFAGTRLAVRRVGELLERGESPATVLEDYPYLSPTDLEFARLYVRGVTR